MSPGPHIAVFFQKRFEDGKVVKKLLTSLQADMKRACCTLFCEKPGDKDIILKASYWVEVGKEGAKKLEPLLQRGLQVVMSRNLLAMLDELEKIIVAQQSLGNDRSKYEVQMIAATHEKLKRRQRLVKKQMAMQVQSKMSPGPHIAVFFREREEDDGWGRELLTSLRADMKGVYFALLCEESGHEHIVPHATRRFNVELGEERTEKLQPLLVQGLQVVMRFLSTLDSLELLKYGLKAVTVPCLEAEFPWDLRAIEMHGNGSIDLLENEEKVEALKQADSAAGWFRNDREMRGYGMLKINGLQRIRYKESEEDGFQKRTWGNMAWVCREHVNSGLKDGTLEPCPLKYHNVDEDYQLRHPLVSPREKKRNLPSFNRLVTF